MNKFKITMVDFIPEQGKHEAGKDKNGEPIFLGDLVSIEGQEYFVVYRYGNFMFKQPNTMHCIIPNAKIPVIKVKNVVASALSEHVAIGYTNEPLYEKLRDTKHEKI